VGSFKTLRLNNAATQYNKPKDLNPQHYCELHKPAYLAKHK